MLSIAIWFQCHLCTIIYVVSNLTLFFIFLLLRISLNFIIKSHFFMVNKFNVGSIAPFFLIYSQLQSTWISGCLFVWAICLYIYLNIIYNNQVDKSNYRLKKYPINTTILTYDIPVILFFWLRVCVFFPPNSRL